MAELKHRDKKKAKADREAFTRLVAEQYFKVTSETIREKDPGALVMGCRFLPFNVPKVVVEGLRRVLRRGIDQLLQAASSRQALHQMVVARTFEVSTSCRSTKACVPFTR